MSLANSAASRRAWSDQFVPSYKEILSDHFKVPFREIREATHQEDYTEATDIVLPNGKTVACKTRRRSIWEQFPHDFGLRNHAPTPYKTEWEKIRHGHGDYLLYTYCDQQEKRIERWLLIDLAVFRNAAKCFFSGCKVEPIHIPERDVHVTTINWYKWPSQYGKLVIASSHKLPV